MNKLYTSRLGYTLLSLFLCLFLQPVVAQKTNTAATIVKLDAYYQKALKDWNVPGMAIAIVKDDSVIFAKGYGVLNNKTGGQVDANTIFGIASNSKAYTSAALATLVDAGKIKWTDKVNKYIPYLKMYSPYVTENLTIEDLLSHRVGLKTFKCF